MKPLLAQLDHGYLNEIAGLENPTIENMCVWFWEKLAPHLPGLAEIVVHETPTARCSFRGPGRALLKLGERTEQWPVQIVQSVQSVQGALPYLTHF